MTEEPHRSRRMAIMKAHPDVVKLMGHEPLTKYVVLAVVSLQIFIAIQLRHSHPFSFWFLFLAYSVGATANHNLYLAMHEITHNLAFKGVDANKASAVFANLPDAVPYAFSFKVCRAFILAHCITERKRYHLEHHKHLGEDGMDVDLPTHLELLCLSNVLRLCLAANIWYSTTLVLTLLQFLRW
jgi:sphingolipid delta-4 desaturase